MGTFEFDLETRNSDHDDRNNCEEERRTCIIAQKIFDQCRIQKCLTGDMLGPARAARSDSHSCNDMLCEGDIIVPPCNAADVSIRDLELERIEILRKRPNPLQKGCWDAELKYVFTYTLEFRRADGCFIGCIPATSMHNLRVTLFGSTESDVTTVTDQFDCCGSSRGGPFIVAEGKAVALQAELRHPCCNPCDCGPCHHDCDCDCISLTRGDAALGAPVAVNVTIGLFTIVKLFRTLNIMVNSLGRCTPERCTSNAIPGDPCRNFDRIRFPMDLFAPAAEPESCCGFGPVFGSRDCDCDRDDRRCDRDRDCDDRRCDRDRNCDRDDRRDRDCDDNRRNNCNFCR